MDIDRVIQILSEALDDKDWDVIKELLEDLIYEEDNPMEEYKKDEDLQDGVSIHDDVFHIDLSDTLDFSKIDKLFMTEFYETSSYDSGNTYTASSSTAFYEDSSHKRYALINTSKKEAIFANNMIGLEETESILVFEYTKKD